MSLLAASLLAIPVVIHLFKPRKVRQTPFSSLRWLHLSQQKLARRVKWHQVLLFLLRAAFLLLLVLALAKPTYSPAGQSGFAERFVILDVSRSMGYQSVSRPSPIEVGKEVAEKIITRGLAGDRTAVLLTGSSSRALGPLARDPEVYLPALRAATAGATDTDLTSALQVIRPMLARRRPGTRVELFFITDNHQQSWRQGGIATFLKDLGAFVHVEVIDLGVAGAQNAWIADARLVESARPARRVIRVQVGCVGDAAQQRIVRVGGLPGLPELTHPLRIEPGNLAQADLELPPSYDTHGKVARIAIGPTDALPGDDQFYLNLDAGAALKVLLVEPESTRAESLRPGFYLRTALQALALAQSHAIEPISRSAANVTPADLAQADVVLLADVPELSDAAVAALEGRVKSGGGLAIFLGPDIQPAFYNQKLHKPLLASEGLMPVALKGIATPPGGLAPLASIQWTHPLLAPLFDPILGDLAQTRFHSFYLFEAAPQSVEVLASIGDMTPALIERPVGAGKVVLFNTTANDDWSDLPRLKSFVPLIDRLLSHLAGSAIGRSFAVGDIISLPLPGSLKPGQRLTVVTPSEARVTPALLSESGRTLLRLGPVQEAGIYRVEAEGGDVEPALSFVVQVGRGDSVLTPTDAAMLKKWWDPVALEIASPDAAVKAPAGQGRIALWPWLTALACAALLAEMFLVHWLCPRMNPGVATPVVPRRGVFSVASQSQTQVKS